jgi:NAD-dependent deacetylase
MELETILSRWRSGEGRLVFLTGAGISAESGIPTFRGPDGFRRVGSRNYSPMELATSEMFRREPETVWCWYLSRFAACAAAEPNAGHRAIAQLQAAHGDRVALITQNVDGLHPRAGSPPERSYAIHGDARFVRCSRSCTGLLEPTPAVPPQEPGKGLSADARALLQCARCAGWLRPHVLWFDEYYNEDHYRSESAMAAGASATLLITVGTTGATTLPMAIGMQCQERGVPIIDVNVEDNAFSMLARRSGSALREAAAIALPRIARLLSGETS